jgi:uncharacterized protein (DUF433 family)
MEAMDVTAHGRITIEPDKIDGQPCIRGLRFPVVTGRDDR